MTGAGNAGPVSADAPAPADAPGSSDAPGPADASAPAGAAPADGEVLALLERVAEAVSALRATLEGNDYRDLGPALEGAERSLVDIGEFPGGGAGLRERIDALPGSARDTATRLVGRAATDHAVNGDLLKLALQRSAALQAFRAAEGDAATYGSGGGIGTVAGSRVSTRA